MSTLETLGSARARNATNVATGQQGPNPAGDAEPTVDMEVDNDGVEDIIEDDDDDDGLIDEELIDYNEDGTATAVEAAAKADRLKNLREKFASQGRSTELSLRAKRSKTCLRQP